MAKYIWHDGFQGTEHKPAEVKPNFRNVFLQKLRKLWNKIIGKKDPAVIFTDTEVKILGDCCSLLDNPSTKPADQVWDDPETATNLNFVRPDLRYLASDRLEPQGYWNRTHEGIRQSQGEKPKAGVTVIYW